jgi:hypothetical protein
LIGGAVAKIELTCLDFSHALVVGIVSNVCRFSGTDE